MGLLASLYPDHCSLITENILENVNFFYSNNPGYNYR